MIASHTFLSSSPREAFWAPTWLTSVRAVNHFSQHFMDLSEFHDTLVLILLQFSGDFGDRAFALRFLWSATAAACFSSFVFRLYLHSHQGLVMVHLLDNFLNPLKLFMAVVSDFIKLIWWRLGGGKERTMYAGPATANRVRDWEKEMKQKFLQMKSTIKIFYHPISSKRVAPDNVDVRVQSKHTSYMYVCEHKYNMTKCKYKELYQFMYVSVCVHVWAHVRECVQAHPIHNQTSSSIFSNYLKVFIIQILAS